MQEQDTRDSEDQFDAELVGRYIRAALITIMLIDFPTCQAVEMPAILKDKLKVQHETLLGYVTKVRNAVCEAVGKQKSRPGSHARNYIEEQLKDLRNIALVDIQHDKKTTICPIVSGC